MPTPDPITELQIAKRKLYDAKLRLHIERYPNGRARWQKEIGELQARVKELAPEVRRIQSEARKTLKSSAKQYAEARLTLIRSLGYKRDPGMQLPTGTLNIERGLLTVLDLDPVPDKEPELEIQEGTNAYGHKVRYLTPQQRREQAKARAARRNEERRNSGT